MSESENKSRKRGSLRLNGIGSVSKSYGTEGEVILSLSIDPEDIELKEPVFIDFDGLPVPFYIDSDSCQQRGRRKLLVRLTDVDTLADAEELVGRTVSVDADSYAGGADPFESDDLSFLIGWKVFKEMPSGESECEESVAGQETAERVGAVGHMGTVGCLGTAECVGVVTEFVDIPGNPCLEVETEKKETVLLPFHEDLILSVNPDERCLSMDIPEGLF